MILYNVHLYREVHLTFSIEADTPEAAAAIACNHSAAAADDIDDCGGETFTALVDVAGDDQYEQSVMIDFDAERLRQAAPELLEAIPALIGLVHRLLPRHAQSDSTLDHLPEVIQARAALARASAIPQPTSERTLP